MTKQSATKHNKKTLAVSHDYYEELRDPKFRRAVDLRIVGAGYRDIARHPSVNVPHATVRRWFMKGGVCYEALSQEMRLIKNDRNKLLKKVDERIKSIMLNALISLEGVVKNINTPPPTIVSATDLLCKLSGVGAPTKIQHSNDPDNPIPAGPIIYLPDNKRNGNNIAKPNPPRSAKS